MLCWEYPPRIVGGLARHVYWLSNELSKLDVKIIVLTLGFPGLPPYEKEGNLEVYRIDSYRLPSPSFLDWVYQFNATMVETASKIIEKEAYIIHAHDWLVAPAAVILKHLYRLPLLATIHSMEQGRRNGLHDDLQRHIHSVEWFLTYEAWRVAVCSQFMKRESVSLFNLPEEKVDITPNGVNPSEWRGTAFPVDRSRYASPQEKIVLYVGRMVYEKGPQVLLEAATRLANRTDVKFIFVGEGPIKPQLLVRAREAGLGNKTFFTGFIEDKELKLLYQLADVIVFPSLYEPFGIVALEGLASKKPVIASNVGGFSEIIKHGETGILVPPNNPDSLASAILKLVVSPDYCRNIGDNGRRIVEEQYSWQKIAKKTLEIYNRIWRDYKTSGWIS
jgi:glycogen(starch) synthase